MTWAIILNGKIQTSEMEKFIEGFNKLIDDTNSELFGRIDKYPVAEYVEYQKAEVKTVESDVEV